MKKFKNSKVYLKNSICNFTPLFDIDYTKKKNIISASFFKLKKGAYKDFSKYVDGLYNLYNFIEKKYPDYSLRLFIDDSIYKDKKIMDKIKKLKNIELVYYSCPNFIIDNIYHRGVFGTFIRFFPMFNFENNDANIVKITDIDFVKNKDDIRHNSIEMLLKTLKKINLDDKIYYLASTRLFHTGIKGNFYKKGKIIPYALTSKVVSLKRFEKSTIINFLTNIDNFNNHLTYYKNNIKKTLNKTDNKKIIFGSDEYFLNHTLIDHLLENKIPMSIRYSYTITAPFYWINDDYQNISEKDKNKVNIFIDFILKNKDSSLSYHDKFKKLDNIMYINKNNNITKKQIDTYKRLYSLYKLINKKKIYFSYFTKDFLKLAIKNKNIIIKDVIATYNLKNKNNEYILNEIKI